MGKLKTKKGVKKRFKLTKTGKVKYSSCGKKHLSISKDAKRIRRLKRRLVLENKKQIKYLKRMLPYG